MMETAQKMTILTFPANQGFVQVCLSQALFKLVLFSGVLPSINKELKLQAM